MATKSKMKAQANLDRLYRVRPKKDYPLKQITAFHFANWQCEACSAQQNLTRDHVVPRSLGGNNRLQNIQILCRKCNHEKGHKIIVFTARKTVQKYARKYLENQARKQPKPTVSNRLSINTNTV